MIKVLIIHIVMCDLSSEDFMHMGTSDSVLKKIENHIYEF